MSKMEASTPATDRDMALTTLEAARDNLKTTVDLLRSIGHDDGAADMEEAIDMITGEIHTLMEEGS